MVDMAHFAGLVAAGEHPNPVPYADVVTSTVHKTLGGPRSGIILSTEELKADINRAVFPGQQGGPLMHVIDQVGITVNRNAIPFDPRPPMNPSGLRIGTPALPTRGFQPEDMTEIGAIISEALGPDFDSRKDSLAARSQALMDKYPLYPALG